MNYENFYSMMQEQGKPLQDNLSSLQKRVKGLLRKVENGELKGLTQELTDLEAVTGQIREMLAAMSDTVSGFDVQSYFVSGDFVQQMLDECREQGIDIRGSLPVYEMFPYRVRVDMENREIYLDRKKIQCVRPKKVAQTIRDGQDKLNSAQFTPQTFVDELAKVYDLCLTNQGKGPGTDVYLQDLYKLLTPMSRFRKEYELQNFAFDLARLYKSDVEQTKSGRKYQFGPSRNNKKAIRILDQDGRERYLALIRFYE